MFSKLAVVATFGLLASCSAEPTDTDGRTGSARQAVLSSTVSDAADDSAVFVRVEGGTTCSGVLVDPELVLTARHCVADVSKEGFDCAPGGNNPSFEANVPASKISVVVGRPNPTRTHDFSAGIQASEVFVSAARVACGNDFAIIRLEMPVSGVPVPRLRLDELTSVGEELTVVGFGVSTTDRYFPPERRRGSVRVTSVVEGTTLGTDEAPRSLETSAGPCEGDSGGPLFSTTGALVAIVSSIFSKSATPTVDPLQSTEYCAEGPVVVEPLQSQRALLLSAFQRVGRSPLREGKPDPLPLGADCTAEEDCASLQCRSLRGHATCTVACTDAACPSGFSCEPEGNERLCVGAVDGGTQGCSAGRRYPGDAPSSTPLGLAVLLATVVVAARALNRRESP